MSNGSAVGRRCQQPSKWCFLPLARPQNDGNDPRFASLMSRQCPLHLDVIAIIRRQKVSADQKQDDICLIQILFDFLMHIIPGVDPPIMPGVDHSLPRQQRQMFLQFDAQHFVLMGVREENSYHGLAPKLFA
jgi:hypothetical protein